MNDRHLSGVPTPADTAADPSYSPYDTSYEQPLYDAYGQQRGLGHDYSADSHDALGTAYGDGDPLFGPLPGAPQATAPAGQWDTGQTAVHGDVSYGTGQWDTTAWTGNPAPSPGEADHASAHGSYDTGGYDSGGYDGGNYDTGAYATGAWDTAGQWDTGQTAAYDEVSYGTGAHETTTWGSGAYTAVDPGTPAHGHEQDQRYEQDQPYEQDRAYEQDREQPGDQAHFAHTAPDEPCYDLTPEAEPEPEHDPADGGPEEPAPARSVTPVRPAGSRGRRRSPKARPKRSALIAVAVPSVCVMGVTAVAAASVTGIGDEPEETAQAAPETAVKPSAANSKLDTQLAGLSADAENFADRASRTQERIDLKERQEAERKRKAAEAARKEALRPKFALPVAQEGLSAYYGQAGINWMSLHSGIDFPVSYGTPVMAATDGTVTTRWNSAYGNMAIVTAADGTETWYCHLSSTKIRSGYVKAGDTIGYAGNSGNSTGPHLHFEVRPAGGSPIDPLPWFRSKGLDPT